jgi:hypothetical protein
MLITISEWATLVQVRCDSQPICQNLAQTVQQPGDFDLARAMDLAREMGWVFRGDGRVLCAQCVERSYDPNGMSIAAPVEVAFAKMRGLVFGRTQPESSMRDPVSA